MISVGRTVHASQRDALVHDRRHARHVFADLDAGHICRDRLELTANLRRCIHLQVVHVLMPRRAAHVDHDDGFVRLADAGDLFGPQQFGQRQTAKRQCSETQRVATSDSVTQWASAMTEN